MSRPTVFSENNSEFIKPSKYIKRRNLSSIETITQTKLYVNDNNPLKEKNMKAEGYMARNMERSNDLVLPKKEGKSLAEFSKPKNEETTKFQPEKFPIKPRKERYVEAYNEVTPQKMSPVKQKRVEKIHNSNLIKNCFQLESESNYRGILPNYQKNYYQNVANEVNPSCHKFKYGLGNKNGFYMV